MTLLVKLGRLERAGLEGRGSSGLDMPVASSRDVRRLRAEGFMRRRTLWAVGRVEKAVGAMGGRRLAPALGQLLRASQHPPFPSLDCPCPACGHGACSQGLPPLSSDHFPEAGPLGLKRPLPPAWVTTIHPHNCRGDLSAADLPNVTPFHASVLATRGQAPWLSLPYTPTS